MPTATTVNRTGSNEVLADLRRPHEAFASGRRFAHVPRPRYLARLDRHVASNGGPLLLSAPSGAGKSALLAYWTDEFRQSDPDTLLIEHYVGCGEGGIDRLDIVRRLIIEIRARFDVRADLPTTPEELLRAFPAWLWYVSERTVIVIDALDRLPEPERSIEWFPRSIPDHVRLIISTSEEGMRDSVLAWGGSVVTVDPFSLAERRDLVRKLMTARGAELTRTQLRHLESGPGGTNPLLLRATVEEARVAAEWGNVDGTIGDYLSAASLEEMYARVLARLEEEFGREPIAELFSLLGVARSGLSVDEIEVLSNEPSLLPIIFARLDFHLGRRGSVVDFHHESLRRAASERYLTSGIVEEIRARIAECCIAASPVTTRHASEAVFQLSQLERWNDVASFLATPNVLLALYRGGTQYEYLSYWQLVAGHADPAEYLRRSLLENELDPFDERLPEALRAAGETCRFTGRWDVALELYREMLRAVERSGDLRGIAEAHNRIGSMLRNRGDVEGALKSFSSAADIAAAANDVLLSATIRGNLGNLHFTTGDFAEAVRCHLENLRVVKELGDRRQIARVSGNLGSALLRLGDYAGAADCFTRMLSIAEEERAVVSVAIALGNMGNIHYEHGRLQEALECFERQERIASSIGDTERIAEAAGNVGNVYFKLGDYDRAFDGYCRMRNLAMTIGARRVLALAFSNIGALHSKRGEIDKARKEYQAAEEEYHLLSDRRGLARVAELWGEVEFDAHNYGEALRRFRDQKRFAEEIGAQPMLVNALGGLSRTTRRLGCFAEAVEHNQRQLVVAESLGNPAVLVRSLRELAGALGNVPGRDDEAYDVFERAISVARAESLVHELSLALRDVLLFDTECRKDVRHLIGELSELVPHISDPDLAMIAELFSNDMISEEEIETLLARIVDEEVRAECSYALWRGRLHRSVDSERCRLIALDLHHALLRNDPYRADLRDRIARMNDGIEIR